jgi:hypothetical protein
MNNQANNEKDVGTRLTSDSTFIMENSDET